VPEFLQERCRAEILTPAVEHLLVSPPAREAQRQGFREALDKLAVPERPSERAADVVLELATRRSKPTLSA